MSRTENQLGGTNGGYACDPEHFSNPGQCLPSDAGKVQGSHGAPSSSSSVRMDTGAADPPATVRHEGMAKSTMPNPHWARSVHVGGSPNQWETRGV